MCSVKVKRGIITFGEYQVATPTDRISDLKGLCPSRMKPDKHSKCDLIRSFRRNIPVQLQIERSS